MLVGISNAPPLYAPAFQVAAVKPLPPVLRLSAATTVAPPRVAGYVVPQYTIAAARSTCACAVAVSGPSVTLGAVTVEGGKLVMAEIAVGEMPTFPPVITEPAPALPVTAEYASTA